MLHPHNPSGVVWTETRPSVANIFEQIQADIQSITSWAWIEREMDLARIRKLSNNWDGFNSDAPDRSVLDRAGSFLQALRERDNTNPPNRVALSPTGSVALEWLQGQTFLRAEVGDSNDVEWMLAIPGRTTEFKTESLGLSASQRPEGSIEPVVTSSSIVQGQEWNPPKLAVAAGAHG